MADRGIDRDNEIDCLEDRHRVVEIVDWHSHLVAPKPAPRPTGTNDGATSLLHHISITIGLAGGSKRIIHTHVSAARIPTGIEAAKSVAVTLKVTLL
jgi:hypothetical protein